MMNKKTPPLKPHKRHWCHPSAQARAQCKVSGTWLQGARFRTARQPRKRIRLGGYTQVGYTDVRGSVVLQRSACLEYFAYALAYVEIHPMDLKNLKLKASNNQGWLKFTMHMLPQAIIQGKTH